MPSSLSGTNMEARSVSLVGYQVRFTPFAPWQFGRMPAAAMGPKAVPDSVIVARMLENRVKNVLIAPGNQVTSQEFQKTVEGELRVLRLGDGGTSLMLGAGIEDISEVGAVAAASTGAAWSIETSAYTVDWPDGYTVGSADDGAPFSFSFERVGGPNEMIVLRGPLVGAQQVPTPDALVGKGQEAIAMDMGSPTPWVEVRYQVHGKAWRQRHHYAVLKPEAVVLVTIQGPEARAEQLAQDGARVAGSVKPRGSR